MDLHFHPFEKTFQDGAEDETGKAPNPREYSTSWYWRIALITTTATLSGLAVSLAGRSIPSVMRVVRVWA